MKKTEKFSRSECIEKSSLTQSRSKNKEISSRVKEQAQKVSERLRELYPDAPCALEYGGEPWKLMVMGRLSAQCTDKRVNEVCASLFERFPTPDALAYADIADIEQIVRPCGLFHVKSSDIKGECMMLVEKYGGVLPDTMEALLEFPGVGRKIANLLLGDIYKKGGIVADTHCIRICGRLGFYTEGEKSPLVCERTMSELIDREEQSDFCHRIVMFGREFCRAASPECNICPLCDLCNADAKRKKAEKIK